MLRTTILLGFLVFGSVLADDNDDHQVPDVPVAVAQPRRSAEEKETEPGEIKTGVSLDENEDPIDVEDVGAQPRSSDDEPRSMDMMRGLSMDEQIPVDEVETQPLSLEEEEETSEPGPMDKLEPLSADEPITDDDEKTQPLSLDDIETQQGGHRTLLNYYGIQIDTVQKKYIF